MLEQLKYIQNVGRFETVRGEATTALKPLTLVYSENGRGKTTLCAVLRSLSTGDSAPILERRRLSAETTARVVVTVGGTDIAFDGNSWTAAGPKVFVFDEHFVDTNVYSGLSIDPSHRQNLHELVIGEDGVRYQRRVQGLTEAISEQQVGLREMERALAEAAPATLSVDEFCALPQLDSLEAQIDEGTRSVSVLRGAETIRGAPGFEVFALPSLHQTELAQTLRASLPELEADALASVSAHLAALGGSAEAEAWTSEGMRLLGDRESCPFCGLGLSGSILVSHYRAYFSEAYRNHKSRISTAISQVAGDLSGDRLARFQRMLQQAKDRREFWSPYLDIPEFHPDSEEVARVWVRARDELLGALQAKAAAPLDATDLNQDARDAIRKYDAVADEIRALSTSLFEMNAGVSRAKEHATHGSLASAEAHLARLVATRKRFEPGINARCAAYLEARAAKADAESRKELAREALDEHRAKGFGKYQTAINRFLLMFNADFQIAQLRRSDARGVPSSTYDLIVNKRRVGLARPADPEPSFRTVLSAGDRSTLALALFFAILRERSSLDDVVVALDDPASSLDDGRAFATAQEIRELIGRAQQVVVLSHTQSLLCQLWESADKDSTATIKIHDVADAEEASTLGPWDVAADAVTDYERLHKLVREYAQGSTGDPQKVAPALRIILEMFVRVAFIEQYSSCRNLGEILSAARRAVTVGTPFMSGDQITELDKLREYANQFHHDTSKANWQENLSNVNERQLKGYSDRVIKFARSGHAF